MSEQIIDLQFKWKTNQWLDSNEKHFYYQRFGVITANKLTKTRTLQTQIHACCLPETITTIYTAEVYKYLKANDFTCVDERWVYPGMCEHVDIMVGGGKVKVVPVSFCYHLCECLTSPCPLPTRDQSLQLGRSNLSGYIPRHKSLIETCQKVRA